MKKQATIQYTIRGVPPEVDQALRKKAAERKVSLNQLVLEELAASENPRQRADFSKFRGTWKEDPEFDAIIASFREIDWDMWK